MTTFKEILTEAPSFTGHTNDRINGFEIIEGSGRNGGQWAVKQGRKIVKIFDSKDKAIKFAEK